MRSVAKRSVVVHIAGQKYAVRSDADETYVRTLARFLDGRIEEVKQASRAVPTEKLTILAALNVADELFRERKRHVAFRERVREKSKEVLRYIESERRRLFGAGRRASG